MEEQNKDENKNKNQENKFSINPFVLAKDLKDSLGMFFAAVRGKFKIRLSSIIWVFFALLYIIIPVDLIPEAVLNVFGLGDDLMVFVFILNQIRPDIERYRQFKLAQKEEINEKDL